jgi:predicted transcriptional regulator
MNTIDEIKSALVKHKISHSEIGEKMGISQQAVQNTFNRSPSDNWVRRCRVAVIDILLERMSLIQETINHE